MQALLLAGCSILLTSYTNSAVDNILLKLIEEIDRQHAAEAMASASVAEAAGSGAAGPGPSSFEAPPVDLTFLRLGNPAAVHPSVRPYLPGGSRCVAKADARLGSRKGGVQCLKNA